MEIRSGLHKVWIDPEQIVVHGIAPTCAPGNGIVARLVADVVLHHRVAGISQIHTDPFGLINRVVVDHVVARRLATIGPGKLDADLKRLTIPSPDPLADLIQDIVNHLIPGLAEENRAGVGKHIAQQGNILAPAEAATVAMNAKARNVGKAGMLNGKAFADIRPIHIAGVAGGARRLIVAKIMNIHVVHDDIGGTAVPQGHRRRGGIALVQATDIVSTEMVEFDARIQDVICPLIPAKPEHPPWEAADVGVITLEARKLEPVFVDMFREL